MRNVKRGLGFLVVGVSAVAATSAYAVSGAGFNPFISGDTSIGYAQGAITNFDQVNSHDVVADLGEVASPGGNLCVQIDVRGVADRSHSAICTVYARNEDNGVATSSVPQGATGNSSNVLDNKIFLKLPNGTTFGYAFSVQCTLPHGSSGFGTVYLMSAFLQPVQATFCN